MQTILPFLNGIQARELNRLICETRKPFLEQIFDVYSVSLPQILIRDGVIVETTYSPETYRVIDQISKLMDDAVRTAVDSWLGVRHFC
jgi:uncharacterized protein (DUF362 family)